MLSDDLAHPVRLAAIARTGLLHQQLTDFDELSELACRLLNTPIAVITIVMDDRQVFAGARGLADPWLTRRQIPLAYSFCQHTVRRARPLVVADARDEPLLRDSPAVHELGVVAYAGVPIITDRGDALGAVCAIDTKPRQWSVAEIDILELLRSCVVSRIGLAEQVETTRVHAAAATVREQYFRKLTDNSPDLLTVVDANGDVAYISGSVGPMLGRAGADVLNKAFTDFVHPEDRGHVRMQFRKLMTAPTTPVRSEARWRHADGSYRILAWRAVNMLGDAAVRGIIVNSSDITEQRRAEDHLRHAQKTELLAQLAVGTVHDLNNALAIICMNADLLATDARANADADTLESVLDIAAAARAAAAMTHRLLAAGRQAPIRPGAIDLAPVLERVIRLAGKALPSTIVLVARCGAAASVWADAGAVEQVVLNLVTNARDAMPNGGTLTIETRLEILDDVQRKRFAWATDTVYLAIAVADTGTGMDEETLAQIFDPFFTTKGVGEGTGLGLPMVAGIMTQLGGGLAVESERGRGTRVTCYLGVTNAYQGILSDRHQD